MRKVYVERLHAGMQLGQDILNEQGKLLLARRAPLTPGYIDGLKSRGHPAVWILDGVADDIAPPSILSSKLRTGISKHMRQLFSAVQQVARNEDEQSDETFFDDVAAAAKPQLADILRDVESMVREVVSAGVISGVVGLKSHDAYTFEHPIEVATAAILLGQRVYMEIPELRVLALGCLFHDLGKIMVPRQILNKATGLTSEEFELVKKHPETGYQMVRRILGESNIIARHIARQHHEQQDGQGYPQGLRGKDSHRFSFKRSFGQGLIIPSAEIVAVADVYSALASDRPYRASLSAEQIFSTMRQMGGTHLNGDLVTRFLSILPVHPVCAQVVVTSGRLQGHRGVVARIESGKPNQPVIRVLYDPEGQQIPPFEVNTSEEEGLELGAPSFAEPAVTSAV